jgi:hypothetical protein
MNKHKQDVARNAERVERDKNEKNAARVQQGGARDENQSAATNSRV